MLSEAEESTFQFEDEPGSPATTIASEQVEGEEEEEGEEEASIGTMLSGIFTGSAENQRSHAIRNQEEEDLGEERESLSADAIRTRKPHILYLEPDVEKAMLAMYLRPNTVFPVHLFSPCIPKKVHFIPANLDGLKVYRVSCTAKDLLKKISDRRYFYMRTTSKTGFRGIRKVGTCQGSWCCQNEECSFLKTEKTKNTSHFVNQAGLKVCYSCGQFAGRSDCGARKLVQYSFGSDHALVYHFGYHVCDLKQEISCDREYTRRWVEKYPNLSYRNLRTTVVQQFLDEQDGTGAQNAAERITYKAYRHCKYKHGLTSDSAQVSTQSIDAVVELKIGSDKLDKFYVYEVNNSAMNNLPDFVVKSGKTVLNFAVEMDQNGPQSILQDEDVYFDGCHSRCKEFISFGLWFRHPSMRRVVKLAGMEMKKEDTEAITIFFSRFNDMLRRITQKPDYNFNPKNLMMDEAGANFAGVKNVLGQKFVDDKCITCQWHFMRNMQEHKFEIDEKFREDFLRYAKELCRVKTIPEFDLLYSKMIEIVNDSPEAGNFLDWHYVRRLRTFPAFRAALHSGANIAEIGNALWKPDHKLALVVAASNDINRMMQFEADYKKFTSGESFLRGQAPTDVQRATAERRFQIEQGRAFADILSNQAAQQMQMEGQQNPPVFRPSNSARHKPKKKGKGVEGSAPPQMRQPLTLSTLLERLTQAKQVSAQPVPQERNPAQPVLGKGPEPRPNRPLPNEKPFVQKIVGGVSVCQGCPTKISKQPAPNDLVFKLVAIRPYREKSTKLWVDRIANIYFHLELQCLQNFNKDLNLQDIRITQDEFAALGEGHLQLLEQCGYLEHIIQLLEAEIQVKSDNIFRINSHNVNNFLDFVQRITQTIALSAEWKMESLFYLSGPCSGGF